MPETGGRFCSSCGKEIAPGTKFCPFCGNTIALPAPPRGEGDATGGLIPYKNQSALIAYYCGVFAVIPCFPIGLVGLILGIQGLKRARENPDAKGKVHAWIGILAGGSFGLLWTVLTVMVVIASFAAK